MLRIWYPNFGLLKGNSTLAVIAGAGSAWLMTASALAAEAEKEGSGGLPQLDPANFSSQIFWMLLVFFLLFQYLRKRVLPRYTEVLEEREEKIVGDLSRAEELRAEAEAAEASYQASLADARQSAHAAITKAQEQAASDTAQRLAKVESSLKGRFTKAENRIAEEKGAAFAELNSIVSDAVKDSVAKIANISPADADVQGVVTTALSDRTDVKA